MNEKMETGRRWLRLVRGDGNEETKREYLTERGYTREELDELFWEERRWERERPLFG
jgi:hypothetical protein